jgi:hypothetical protein
MKDSDASHIGEKLERKLKQRMNVVCMYLL